jgi:hypothetical protein
MRRTKPTINCRFRKSTPLCHLRLEALEDRSLPSILTVTSTADSGTGSLRAALAAAADGDTIVFALPGPSTIQLTSGSLTVNAQVSIVGLGASALTIQGDHAHSDIVINAPSIISGIRITGGGGSVNGGGILSNTLLTLSNCAVTENGGADGAGIAALSDISLFACTVSGNHATETGGGIIVLGYAQINNCVFGSNTANQGGGIDIGASGQARISDTTITGNIVDGGAYGGGLVNSGSTILIRSTVSYNSLISGSPNAGGGILASEGSLTLIDSSVIGNAVSGFNAQTNKGGGIAAQTGSVTVISSTIAQNSVAGGDSASAAGPGFGGGIESDAGAIVSLVNSTIAGNTAQGGTSATARGGEGAGGALYINGPLTMTNCTVADNQALRGDGTLPGDVFGGGAYMVTGPTQSVTNSIFAGNSPTPDAIMQTASVSFCLIGVGDGFNPMNGANGNLVGTAASPINARLGPLQNNGGPTQTMALLTGSFAIDSGNNAALVGTSDQRGMPRIIGRRVDEGAVEYQAIHLLAVGADSGGRPEVKVYDAATGALRLDFNAYDSHFLGGVRVAVGDMNADGVPDIICAPGPGGGPDIRVFSGTDGSLLEEFYAYDPHFNGGIFVAVQDFAGFGQNAIITGPDFSGGPDVRVFFSGNVSGKPNREFMAYDPGFLGGVRVAAADMNGDNFPDIICAPGLYSGPDIRIFNGQFSLRPPVMIGEFLAYDYRYFGGVFVTAGDVNGDGRADLITGTNGNGGPEVKAYNGATVTGNPTPAILSDFFAYDQAFNGGARAAVVNLGGDSVGSIITGAGPGGGPHVRAFDPSTSTQLQKSTIDSFMAFDPSFSGGVFVGGA